MVKRVVPATGRYITPSKYSHYAPTSFAPPAADVSKVGGIIVYATDRFLFKFTTATDLDCTADGGVTIHRNASA